MKGLRRTLRKSSKMREKTEEGGGFSSQKGSLSGTRNKPADNATCAQISSPLNETE